MIYLDGAATYPILPEAKKAIMDAYDLPLGNASALHSAGVLARDIINDAREHIAYLIGAEPHEIIFTSGGSESNNTIMHVFEGKNISVSPYEHPSVIESAKKYAKAFSFYDTKTMSTAETHADLISIMLANNETGAIFLLPTKSQRKGAFLHSDLTQALGKMPINVHELDLDYATISSHKIGGPIGIGALYVKNGVGKNFVPLILGGHQENGARAGTYNTPLIAGFGAAAKYCLTHKTWEVYEQKIRPLRNLLAQRITTEIPGAILNTDLDHSLPNILNVSFASAEGESIQLYLDLKKGITVSTGSACASGTGKPSHVLMAISDGDAERAHSSIRFSFTLDTTGHDIEEVMSVLPDIIKNLQGISTL